MAQVAAGLRAGLPAGQHIIAHPCDEDGAASGRPWPSHAECVPDLRTQPRFNMRWPVDDHPVERARVSCDLTDEGGNARTLAQRLLSAGAMELRCEDILEMSSPSASAAKDEL